MFPPSQQSGNGSGFGPSKRNRRSTSDISSAIKEGKRWFTTSKKPSNTDTTAFPGTVSPFFDPVAADNLNQLRKYTLKIKNATKSINHVDSAWSDYIKHREKCFECCKTLIAPLVQRKESSMVSPTTVTSPRLERQRDQSLDTLSLVAIETSSSTQSSGSRADSPFRPGSHSGQYQKATHDWEATIEFLSNTLRTSLQETYNKYDKGATDEGFERLCADKHFRHTTIFHMRNASISRTMSADLDFFPKYDVRFRNYDEIKKDLAKVRALLGTSGIPQSRTIIEHRISPNGDVMLEFVNAESESYPVLRFRVASSCLRETSSPIFGHMFSAHFLAELDDDLKRSLPLPPTRHVCSDGTEVALYRMPQTELNVEGSLEILLHAAHTHNDKVPREVQFGRFVAIAEACLRYQCTSPLELAVEYRWLPYWRENATDDMLAEALLISYVFGLAKNFTHLSKIAILNMGGPDYVQCKPWPRKIEEKLVAVRSAKIEQVYEICRMTLNEFLCPAPRADPVSSPGHGHTIALPSGLRCPRGDRACDAQNLGWFMKSLAELGLLPAVLPSPALSRGVLVPETQSLLQIIQSLCQITSPPQCHHGGICDFMPAFRDAVEDVSESLAGPTLLDVSGRHGWALSKNGSLRRGTAREGDGGGGEQLFEIITRQSPRDLRAAALTNRRFYQSYRRNETRLLEGIRGAGWAGGPMRATATRHRGRSSAGGSAYDNNKKNKKNGDEDNNDDHHHHDDLVRTWGGIPPPWARFSPDQIFPLENKRLLDNDTNKYAADTRQRAAMGFRVREWEGVGQGSDVMR
ncbi:hypothetical protein SAMD00023353_2301280 [Rosellinia necatrix]|uniref:Uncharacterized protein n=1 Tax=Rosellinia necatrix TaxID=77044 RepID=A0A1W2TGD8_ROSNE|nr:hypothetical protein SAMD00023353_2301280 [Rosellinia necatrix]